MICKNYDPVHQHRMFARVQYVVAINGWARSKKPVGKSWVHILGEITVGLILAAGIVMVLAGCVSSWQ